VRRDSFVVSALIGTQTSKKSDLTVFGVQPCEISRVRMGVETVLAIGAVWALAAGLAVAFGAAAKRGDDRRAAIIARRMAEDPAPATTERGRFDRDPAPEREPASTYLVD
jgi:hypothetical protein